MEILCLTGWQQEKDALKTLAPSATHFDYSAYDNVERAFAALPKAPDIAIGWSLGGQLLVRAVAAKAMLPKKLILLGAPFQFIAGKHFAYGMQAAGFEDVKKRYASDPQTMLAQFQAFVAAGDEKQMELSKKLLKTKALWQHGLFWLEELGRASCYGLDFSHFPKTLIAHGENDQVIHPANAREFAKAIPGTELFLLPSRGHALHYHSLPFGL